MAVWINVFFDEWVPVGTWIVTAEYQNLARFTVDYDKDEKKGCKNVLRLGVWSDKSLVNKGRCGICMDESVISEHKSTQNVRSTASRMVVVQAMAEMGFQIWVV